MSEGYEKLEQALTALAAERKVKERLENDVIKYNDICVKERRKNKRLVEYVQHLPGCNTQKHLRNVPCTCGLEQAIKKGGE